MVQPGGVGSGSRSQTAAQRVQAKGEETEVELLRGTAQVPAPRLPAGCIVTADLHSIPTLPSGVARLLKAQERLSPSKQRPFETIQGQVEGELVAPSAHIKQIGIRTGFSRITFSRITGATAFPRCLAPGLA